MISNEISNLSKIVNSNKISDEISNYSEIVISNKISDEIPNYSEILSSNEILDLSETVISNKIFVVGNNHSLPESCSWNSHSLLFETNEVYMIY
ncbi:hypothetical protein HanPSC8_Chr06g0240591 [Helianthus annuus]|nr:hypothetical protein HanPSC8_Chr06g0240591 [Helianthus annuus]